MLEASFLIVVLPLVGFLVLTFGGRRIGDPLAGWIATSAVGLSFVVTLVVFAGLLGRAGDHRSFVQTWFAWLPVGGLQVKFALLVDPLSVTMALFVTGVSTVIHLYSIGYMRGDVQYRKFFVYLNLFVFSMLVLVLANNFVFTFLGWEGVGLCSYLLVAFWFDRDSAASAGKKAFIVNRIGDFGFLVAMFLTFTTVGTLDYTGVFSHAGAISSGTATAITLLLFMGAVGKSAQIPLFVWLPDAMEGPTPVSALIHAATMVTAGVYLMVRVNPLLAKAPATLDVIAIIGVATAFVAATIACAQTDIKKVLAYSTVSQLGYMFLAVGARAYAAAIFLMLAHAFYKGLLFLDAGSVIHANRDNQDLKLMGGLRRFMPATYLTFFIAWFAIGGVPPLSGFWAKGDVLINSFSKSPGLWAVGLVTAALTAYYMGREFFLAFHGPERWHVLFASPEPGSVGDPHGGAGGPPDRVVGSGGDVDRPPVRGHGATPHEAPLVMRIPLYLLAFCAALGGFVNLPFHPHFTFLETWLAPLFGTGVVHLHYSAGGQWGFAVADAVFAFLGVGVAALLWSRAWDRPALEPRFLLRGWRVDDLYDLLINRPSTAFADLCAFVVDNRVIDGAVNATGSVVRGGGTVLRRLQTGYVRNYALGFTAGMVLLLAWILSRAGS